MILGQLEQQRTGDICTYVRTYVHHLRIRTYIIYVRIRTYIIYTYVRTSFIRGRIVYVRAYVQLCHLSRACQSHQFCQLRVRTYVRSYVSVHAHRCSPLVLRLAHLLGSVAHQAFGIAASSRGSAMGITRVQRRGKATAIPEFDAETRVTREPCVPQITDLECGLQRTQTDYANRSCYTLLSPKHVLLRALMHLQAEVKDRRAEQKKVNRCLCKLGMMLKKSGCYTVDRAMKRAHMIAAPQEKGASTAVKSVKKKAVVPKMQKGKARPKMKNVHGQGIPQQRQGIDAPPPPGINAQSEGDGTQFEADGPPSVDDESFATATAVGDETSSRENLSPRPEDVDDVAVPGLDVDYVDEEVGVASLRG